MTNIHKTNPTDKIEPTLREASEYSGVNTKTVSSGNNTYFLAWMPGTSLVVKSNNKKALANMLVGFSLVSYYKNITLIEYASSLGFEIKNGAQTKQKSRHEMHKEWNDMWGRGGSL